MLLDVTRHQRVKDGDPDTALILDALIAAGYVQRTADPDHIADGDFDITADVAFSLGLLSDGWLNDRPRDRD